MIHIHAERYIAYFAALKGQRFQRGSTTSHPGHGETQNEAGRSHGRLHETVLPMALPRPIFPSRRHNLIQLVVQNAYYAWTLPSWLPHYVGYQSSLTGLYTKTMLLYSESQWRRRDREWQTKWQVSTRNVDPLPGRPGLANHELWFVEDRLQNLALYEVMANLER